MRNEIFIFIAFFVGSMVGFITATIIASGKIEDSYRRGLVSGRGLKIDALEH